MTTFIKQKAFYGEGLVAGMCLEEAEVYIVHIRQRDSQQETVFLTPEDARGLRDWLNTVLSAEE